MFQKKKKKTRLDFLGLSRIEQANAVTADRDKGADRAEWNFTHISVSIQSELVRTVRTSAQLAGRTKGTPLYKVNF